MSHCHLVLVTVDMDCHSLMSEVGLGEVVSASSARSRHAAALDGEAEETARVAEQKAIDAWLARIKEDG